MQSRIVTRLIAVALTAFSIAATAPSPAAASTPSSERAVVTNWVFPARATPVTRIVALVNVNIRSGPGTGFARTGRLGAGEVRAVIGASNDLNWWHVSCADGTGWVSANPFLTKPIAWRK